MMVITYASLSRMECNGRSGVYMLQPEEADEVELAGSGKREGTCTAVAAASGRSFQVQLAGR